MLCVRCPFCCAAAVAVSCLVTYLVEFCYINIELVFMFSVLFLVFWNNYSSRYIVAEENMEVWSTVLVPFLVGAVTVLLVVLWWVFRARSMHPTSFGVLSERSSVTVHKSLYSKKQRKRYEQATIYTK